tara:strand:+ start:51 stop:1259 length:1209 start_codon:yes stop_codon:yes gene_type:complete
MNDLLGLFLSNKFYEKNRHLISLDFFENDAKKIWKGIELGHTRYSRDLSESEIEQIVFSEFRTLTTSQKQSLIVSIRTLQQDIGEDVAEDVLRDQFQAYFGRQLADIGIKMMDGKEDNLVKVQELISKYEENFLPKTTIKVIEHDVVSLLDATKDVSKYKWNLKSLHKICPGIGPATFTAVFALVETGKTAFLVSTLFGKGGFLSQGAKILIVGNEEKVDHTALRAVSSFSGLTKEEIIADPQNAHDIWDVNANRCVFSSDEEVPSMEILDQLIAQHKPDIVGVDQLDKMHISGDFARDDLRLAEIYRRARNMAKKHSCAFIGVSQASAEADGRTVLRFTQMSGSRVGKAAEADLIIGIGKETEDMGEDNLLRHIYVSKNKLGGTHGTCSVIIQPQISRYTD